MSGLSRTGSTAVYIVAALTCVTYYFARDAGNNSPAVHIQQQPLPHCRSGSHVILLDDVHQLVVAHETALNTTIGRLDAEVTAARQRQWLLPDVVGRPRVCVRDNTAMAKMLMRFGAWGDCVHVVSDVVRTLDAWSAQAERGRSGETLTYADVGAHVGACAILMASWGLPTVAVEDDETLLALLADGRALSAIPENRLAIRSALTAEVVGEIGQRRAAWFLKVDSGHNAADAVAVLTSAKQRIAALDVEVANSSQLQEVITRMKGFGRPACFAELHDGTRSNTVGDCIWSDDAHAMHLFWQIVR
jgi:hypothetical protein